MRRTATIILLLLVFALILGQASRPKDAGASSAATDRQRIVRLERLVSQLQRDVVALKSSAANFCLWFKHPPSVEEFTLHNWFQGVGLGCSTFGLR